MDDRDDMIVTPKTVITEGRPYIHTGPRKTGSNTLGHASSALLMMMQIPMSHEIRTFNSNTTSLMFISCRLY